MGALPSASRQKSDEDVRTWKISRPKFKPDPISLLRLCASHMRPVKRADFDALLARTRKLLLETVEVLMLGNSSRMYMACCRLSICTLMRSVARYVLWSLSNDA